MLAEDDRLVAESPLEVGSNEVERVNDAELPLVLSETPALVEVDRLFAGPPLEDVSDELERLNGSELPLVV